MVGGGGGGGVGLCLPWIRVCIRIVPLCVSVEFLSLSVYQSVCLSKYMYLYMYMPVCLHVSLSPLSLLLSLSQHMWCRPSRPGIPSSIPGNSIF